MDFKDRKYKKYNYFWINKTRLKWIMKKTRDLKIYKCMNLIKLFDGYIG
jgi:hypothetical protein